MGLEIILLSKNTRKHSETWECNVLAGLWNKNRQKDGRKEEKREKEERRKEKWKKEGKKKGENEKKTGELLELG